MPHLDMLRIVVVIQTVLSNAEINNTDHTNTADCIQFSLSYFIYLQSSQAELVTSFFKICFCMLVGFAFLFFSYVIINIYTKIFSVFIELFELLHFGSFKTMSTCDIYLMSLQHVSFIYVTVKWEHCCYSLGCFHTGQLVWISTKRLPPCVLVGDRFQFMLNVA